MNKDISVRSLLVDKITGRYIKAVDEQDLSDFVHLFTKKTTEPSKMVLFDFSSTVNHFHNLIDKNLSARENKELLIKRNTVFNTWTRLKSQTNESLLCQTASLIIKDSEEVLNWIYTRLPDLEKAYNHAYPTNRKNEALLRLADEVDVFIEILLCNIHTTAKIDIKSFKFDCILTQHSISIRDFLLNLLQREVKFYQGRFSDNSLIYQCCMENLNINPEVLLSQLNSEKSKIDLMNEIINKATLETHRDKWSNIRQYTISWHEADPEEIKRTKTLSQLLQKVEAIISLLEQLKTFDISFDESSNDKEEFEAHINKLLPSR